MKIVNFCYSINTISIVLSLNSISSFDNSIFVIFNAVAKLCLSNNVLISDYIEIN